MIEIIGIDHIYISVSDMKRSESFYDKLFGAVLGFRKNTFDIEMDPHIHYYNRHFGYVIRPAKSVAVYDKYSPGLHHCCLRVDSIDDLTTCAKEIEKTGIQVFGPEHHPEYAPDYWAVYVMDPDGMLLEITNYREERRRRFTDFNSQPFRT